MSWGRIDDTLWAHPKVGALEEHGPQVFAQAIAIWTIANSWCRRFASETGEVTLAKLRKLVPFSPVRGVKALVDVGLMEATPKGYRFHDWGDYSPEKSTNKSPKKSPNNSGNKSPNKSHVPPPKSLRKRDTPITPTQDTSKRSTQQPPYDGPSGPPDPGGGGAPPEQRSLDGLHDHGWAPLVHTRDALRLANVRLSGRALEDELRTAARHADATGTPPRELVAAWLADPGMTRRTVASFATWCAIRAEGGAGFGAPRTRDRTEAAPPAPESAFTLTPELRPDLFTPEGMQNVSGFE